MPIAFIVLAIWIYLLVGRGGFWRVRLRRQSILAPASVIAIIPARNEAEVIGRSVRSLLNQATVDLRIILIDDHSSDGTAAIARDTAAGDERLTITEGKPLPEGWTGKLWAVQQGIDTALADNADFLLLTDADIEHTAENVASLVAVACSGGYDLASYMVKLHCASFAERLLIPAFVYFFFQLYPPAWTANPKAKTAGAAGGCMIIRPEAVLRAGAMQSIKGEIIDDCALARAVKRGGGKVWLGPTESARSIRPYRSFGEIEHMIARTAFSQLRHSWALLAVAMVGLLLTYVVPVVLLSSQAWMVAAIACLLMVVSYAPMVRLYRLRWIWALTLPVAAIFYMAATVHSAIRYASGSGGEWKGRAQDAKPFSAPTSSPPG